MLDDLIRKYAALYGVPEAWIYGVIQAESNGNADAFNAADPSYGLMGIMLGTARDMGYTGAASGLFNPETNVAIGTKYLAWIRDRWKTDNPAEIYSAYNSGRPDRYITSDQVASNVERFLRFASEWTPVVAAGGAIGVLLVAVFVFMRRRGR